MSISLRRMPPLPAFIDPEAPGSRFASRPGVTILTRAEQRNRYAPGTDTGNAAEVVADALGQDPREVGIGAPVLVDGSDGGGASGWTPVVEWLLDAAGAGIVGTIAVSGVREAAHQFGDLLDRLRGRDASFLVNRAGAALVAIAAAQAASQKAVLEVEAVEEFSALAGREATEGNPVGAEPWLVSLVDLSRTVRHLVVVTPDGRVQGQLQFPIGEIERVYMPPSGASKAPRRRR